MCLLFTVGNILRSFKVGTDVGFGLGALLDIDFRKGEVGTRSVSGTVDVDNRVFLFSSRTMWCKKKY